MSEYVYLVSHPEYQDVRVSALDKVDAIRKACANWRADWKWEAARATAVQGGKARAGLCPRCRGFSATGGLCVQCQALEQAGKYRGTNPDRHAGVRGGRK